MNYEGNLYGKVGKRYVELDCDTKYVDDLILEKQALEQRNSELVELVQRCHDAVVYNQGSLEDRVKQATSLIKDLGKALFEHTAPAGQKGGEDGA